MIKLKITFPLCYLIVIIVFIASGCSLQCPIGDIVQWCPNPDEPGGVRPICCPDMNFCNCMDEPTIPGFGVSQQMLSGIPEPDLSDTTLDGVVDFGTSSLLIEIPGENDKIDIPVKGRLAMNGGICAQHNCPLEIILLELSPLNDVNLSKKGRVVKNLFARNANRWKGSRDSLGNVAMSSSNKLALEATIDGKKFGKIINPNNNFNGKLIVETIRDKGGSNSLVKNNRLWVQGHFSDGQTYANFEISIWLTNCYPVIQLQANCYPNIESGLPGHISFSSTVTHQGNFNASYDLCSAMYTESYEDICTAKKTGDDIIPSTFSCLTNSEINPIDPSELSKYLKYEWIDAKLKTLATKKQFTLDNVPIFPAKLTVENKWGKAESKTIQEIDCLKTMPLSPGGCAWYWVENSHSASGTWCPEGSFISQYVLDVESGLQVHDSPIIRKVRCCVPEVLPFPPKWDSCEWVKVGAQKSHNKLNTWCPNGTFLTQMDLDGDRDLSGSDSPIIGHARCCEPQSSIYSKWGQCLWSAVGPQKSYSSSSNWCPHDFFLIQVDLNGGSSGKDFPVVGEAWCCPLK